MALGIDKGKALEKSLSKLGIRPEETIAFGDAENDISMLKYVGIGVAMGNVSDEVNSIADEITLDNNHDGIAEVIERYI